VRVPTPETVASMRIDTTPMMHAPSPGTNIGTCFGLGLTFKHRSTQAKRHWLGRCGPGS
jgi:hypothetical protein